MNTIVRFILGLVILGAIVAAGIILVGKKPEPAPIPFYNRSAVKKTKTRLSQAAVNKVITPLSEDIQEKFKQQYPEAWQWIDKFRALYASLPPGAKKEIAETGEYSFKIGDLPKSQADLMREWLEKDDRTRTDLEAHTGKPLNPSEVTFSFVVGGGLVQLRYGTEGFNAGWGPIGKTPESKEATPEASGN